MLIIRRGENCLKSVSRPGRVCPPSASTPNATLASPGDRVSQTTNYFTKKIIEQQQKARRYQTPGIRFKYSIFYDVSTNQTAHIL